MNIRNVLLALVVILSACNTSKDIVYTAPMDDYEETILDTMQISAPAVMKEISYTLPVYNESYTRTIDLIHTKLNLKFDWAQQHVIGTADLVLRPLFYTTNTIVLHAQNFDILSVKLNGVTAQYRYDGAEITINSTTPLTRENNVNLSIDYIAKPNEGPVGGSAAITSDKGLFFINPLNEEPNKPMQIWTQGETENNSRWFPTIDKPNEKCTQEIYVTVQDRFKTLSNGLLISSVKNNDGTRTDYWKQDKPHAPYLFMLAIGEYAVATDTWNGKAVDYYVEEEYADDAKEIFNHTPEMIQFFSDILDYPYPWDKYSQVICRDYVSGAMENTSAVIFGEFVQKNHRELIDNDNDLIVAHELFHHWFGDLVTCESWANLTLNEGFANYSEYLWYEHKYGKMRADLHRMNELNNYVGQVDNQGGHPLIHYGYDDKEEMFDAHSYNKGGLVLHMLRDYLGDEAFFAGLHKYLVDNEYTAVETAELRMAFEDTTGEDLNWFFNQWYFESGHPKLNVEYDYDQTTDEVVIKVDQVQSAEENAVVYILPTTIYVYDHNGTITSTTVRLNQRSEEVRFKTVDGKAPALVLLDGKDILLAEINEQRSTQDYLYMAAFETPYTYKRRALKALKGNADAQQTYATSLDHDFYGVRVNAIQNINITDANINTLETMAKNDVHSDVRSNALKALAKHDAPEFAGLAKEIILKDQAYTVIGEALSLLNTADDPENIVYAEKLKNEKSGSVSSAVADAFIQSEDPKYASFFTDKIKKTSVYELFPLMNKYTKYIQYMQPDQLSTSAKELSSIALNPSENKFKRFMVTSAISNMKNMLKGSPELDTNLEVKSSFETISGLINKIKESETDEGLKSRYMAF